MKVLCSVLQIILLCKILSGRKACSPAESIAAWSITSMQFLKLNNFSQLCKTCTKFKFRRNSKVSKICWNQALTLMEFVTTNILTAEPETNLAKAQLPEV